MALPALAPLVITLVCIALALVIYDMMNSVGDVAAGIPVVGGAIARAAKAIAHAINKAVSKAEALADGLIGLAWHVSAGLMNRLWHQIKAHAGLLAHMSSFIATLMLLVHLLKHQTQALARHAGGKSDLLHKLQARVGHLAHRLTTVEADVNRFAHAHVLPRLGAVERDLGRVEDKVIPGIQDTAQAAVEDVTALQKWIRAHALLVGTSALVGAVAWALSQIGLGGLRCNTLTNMLGKRGCGLWKGLEDVLGLFIDAIALTHLCDLPKWINEFLSPFLGELTGLISGAAKAVCAEPNPAWSNPNVPGLHLPPASEITQTL